MKKIYSHLFTALYASLALAISACSKSDGSSPSLSMDETPNTKVEIREILEVETDTVGTLAAKIGEKSSVVQKLIINGPIDAVDVRTIHSLPQLLAIDMKNATICGGDSTFTYNKTAYKLYDNEVVRYMYPSQLSEIILPDNLKVINDHAFYKHNGSNPYFTEIIIPESVERIGENSFSECSYLQHVKLPENLQKIEVNTFYKCSNLNSIEIGSKLKEIGTNAFMNCKALETINIPNSVTSIGSQCFYQCTSLKSITLSNTLNTVGHHCFALCDKLTTITFPPSITSVDIDIFHGCYHLTSIFWESKATIPKNFSSSTNHKNQNLLLYLSNSNTLVLDTFIKNIVINGIANEIVLTSTSNSSFFVPQEFKTIKLSYTRNFAYPTYPGEAAGWRSISLPFTVTSITHSDGRVLAPFNANVTGAKPFWLRRLTKNGFENVTQIEAGVPYIIAMPNNEAYDDEYNITGNVTFTAQNAQGITIPVTSTLASDIGPEFVLNCNYSYIPASMTIYALNETATNTQKAGSVFVRNERAVLPFEGYVSSSASSVSASPSYYRIDNNMPVTRSNRPLGPIPTIEDM